MKFSLRLLCLVPLMIVAFCLPCRATAQTGSLHGTVVDPSGAVVPSARITLTQGPTCCDRIQAKTDVIRFAPFLRGITR